MAEKESPVLVAIDAANTYGKGIIMYLENGKLCFTEFSIPHAYMPLNASQWKEVQATSGMGRGNSSQTHSFQYVIGGDATMPETLAVKIGKSAGLSGNQATVYGNGKYKTGYMDAYLTAILCEAFPKREWPKGYSNIYLAIGFPSSDWQMVNETLLPLIRKNHRIIDADGSKRAFQLRYVMTVDENGGGMMNTLHRMMKERVREAQSGQYTSLEAGEDILMLDAGGWLGSMAWGEVTDGGFPQIDYTSGRVHSIDGGIVTVRTALKEVLKGQYSRELQGLSDSMMNDKWMDTLMLEKSFTLSGRKHELDVTDAITEASGVYLNNVKAAYAKAGEGKQAAHIILTGGTINPLYEQILSLLNHGSVILSENRHEIYKANVRGIMQILIDKLLADGKMPDSLMPYFDTRKAVS